MADPSSPIDYSISELIESVRDVRYTQMVSFVAATIVVYDYTICFEREVELIWKKRWSVIKLAFIWHRYFGVFCALFQAYALNTPLINDETRTCSCTFWFYWETWGYSAVLFTSEAVLLLWIYVIYNKNRWILTLLASCYLVEVVSVITILTVSFEGFVAKAYGVQGTGYCVMTNIGAPFSLLWIPILGYDAILLFLFLYRGCAGCAGASPDCSGRWAYSYDVLLDMIYRHSLLNFLAIFGSYLACAIMWLMCSLGLYQIPVSFALSLSITNCTRLLLNIRRAYYCTNSDPTHVCNIGDMPLADPTSPMLLMPPTIKLDVPLTPSTAASPSSAMLSASSSAVTLSHFSGRELSAPPASTLRVACASTVSTVLATIGHGPEARERDGSAGVSVRTVAAGPHRARENVGMGDRERPMYLEAEVGAQWWQYELHEMHAEAGVIVGEAV